MVLMENNFYFISNSELENWIQKVENSAFYEVLFAFCLFIFFSFLMYQKATNKIWYFMIGELGLICLVIISIYGSTIRRARVINNTVQCLYIDKDVILIRTFAYNILGLKNIPEKEIEIKPGHSSIHECIYPIQDNKYINGKVFRINVHYKHNYFILSKYFPNDINNYLL
jgi:hypothetical protein